MLNPTSSRAAPAKLRSLLLGAAAMTALGAIATTVPAQAGVTAKSQAAGHVKSEGRINLRALAAAAASHPGDNAAAPRGATEKRVVPYLTFRTHHPFSATEAAASAPHATSASTFAPAATIVSGFNALDHADQRLLADGGNQFSLEPPDQALAVGKGFVLESVNNAIQVYDTTGKPLLAAPVAMNRFFNQESEINRTNGQRGPFFSDPRAYYDSATGRFFVSEWTTLNDASGNGLGISLQFLAVSATSNPTGGWFIYSYETTDSGEAGCPCLPDFNQLGADANGVYITNNFFNIFSLGFAGAKIYALQKGALENGTGGFLLSFPIMGNDFSIHPTVTPPHGHSARELHGTEYMVEGTADLTSNGIGNALIIYALANTDSLATTTPSLTLLSTTVPSENVSANMPPAIQKDGPRPLGGPQAGGFNDPVPLLNPDDARLSSPPVYVNAASGPGTIWAVSSTAVTNSDKSVRNGVAWFQLQTSGNASSFAVSMTNQGIIAGPGDSDMIYPAIAMTTAGAGGIGVTVTSASRYPSTAFIAMPEFVRPTIKLLGVGALPDDGFTAYPQEGPFNGVGRWGDYGAAQIDDSGNLWLANEYIPPTTASHPRSLLANWGTFIAKVKP